MTATVSSSINSGRLQPLQGFDTFVYFQDQGTGNLIPFGEFTGFQYTIRNASEPYITLGSRTYNYLDGEYQIGWVAEQGKINLDAIPTIIGFDYVGPLVRIGRSPRFQIVVEYNAKELQNASVQKLGTSAVATGVDVSSRTATGRYLFTQCKIDVITSGIMAGRSIIADRIEGLAEGWGIDKNNNLFNPPDSLTLAGGDGNAIKGTTGVSLSTVTGVASSIPDWATTITRSQASES